MTLADVLAKLDRVQSFGSYWKARCPAHDDGVASLSVRDGDKQAVVLHCFAGCTFEQIMSALSGGESAGGRAAPPESPRPVGQREPVATYEYKKLNGRLFATKYRFADKSFTWMRPGGAAGLGGEKAPLYRLNDVRRRLDKVVPPGVPTAYFAEGEKDADTLWGLKLPALSNQGGASEAWTEQYTDEVLQSGAKQLVVFYDNDAPGIKHGHKIAQAMLDAGLVVKLIDLPGIAPKGDVTDWMQTHSRDELVAVIRGASFYVGAGRSGGKKRAVSRTFNDIESRNVSYLWPGHIPLGFISLIVGVAGEGKSYTTVDLASRLSNGAEWPDGTPIGLPRRVILIPGEDTAEEVIKPRLEAAGANMALVHVLDSVEEGGKQRPFSLADDVDALEEMVRQTGATWIVVDPVNAFIKGKVDIYKNTEVREVLEPIRALCADRKIAFTGVMHLSKSQQQTVLFQIGGSAAFGELPRAVFCVKRDKDDKDRRFFTCAKLTFMRRPETRAFSISGGGIAWEKDAVQRTAEDVMEQDGPKKKRGQGAVNRGVAFLEKYLAPGAHPYGNTVVEEAAVHGINERALRKAADELGVVITVLRDGDGRITGSTWSLPLEREAF